MSCKSCNTFVHSEALSQAHIAELYAMTIFSTWPSSDISRNNCKHRAHSPPDRREPTIAAKVKESLSTPLSVISWKSCNPNCQTSPEQPMIDWIASLYMIVFLSMELSAMSRNNCIACGHSLDNLHARAADMKEPPSLSTSMFCKTCNARAHSPANPQALIVLLYAMTSLSTLSCCMSCNNCRACDHIATFTQAPSAALYVRLSL
mmetsp:Transcript_165367/g.525518  ORF Transcript_165367/g.525518 Transcript_165367/m.525518 type:complete len:205 (+) Transcript_165367:247-861(+)